MEHVRDGFLEGHPLTHLLEGFVEEAEGERVQSTLVIVNPLTTNSSL